MPARLAGGGHLLDGLMLLGLDWDKGRRLIGPSPSEYCFATGFCCHDAGT